LATIELQLLLQYYIVLLHVNYICVYSTVINYGYNYCGTSHQSITAYSHE